MKLKNAAFFAVVGTALWTVLLAIDLVRAVSGVARGFVPAVSLVTSSIEFIAVLSLLIFIAAFYRSQS